MRSILLHTNTHSSVHYLHTQFYLLVAIAAVIFSIAASDKGPSAAVSDNLEL